MMNMMRTIDYIERVRVCDLSSSFYVYFLIRNAENDADFAILCDDKADTQNTQGVSK